MTKMQVEQKRNPSASFLLWGGVVALVVGGVVALLGGQAGQSSDRVAQFSATLNGDANYMNATGDGAGYVLMWVGIAVAIIGAVMALMFVSGRARQS
jgi:hypothetical protein